MFKNKFLRRGALLISLVMLLTATVNTTLGYIVTKTDSLINTFVPVVSEPDDTAVRITVNTTIKNTGNLTISPAGFEFILENTETGEKRILESDENGNAMFVLPYTDADAGKTYTFKLTQTDEGVAGIIYDTKVYEITISLVLDDDNQLTAIVTVDGEVVDPAHAKFVNIYHADQPETPPTGDTNKITFWFILMIVSGSAFVTLVILDRKYIRAEH